MRYRTLDAQGDYTFGASALNFLVNSLRMVTGTRDAHDA